MLVPLICSWVEETHGLSALGIDTSDIGAFLSIAAAARPRKIAALISPAVLLGDDMLEVKDLIRIGRFGQVAVLTSLMRASPSGLPRTDFHKSLLAIFENFSRLELEKCDDVAVLNELLVLGVLLRQQGSVVRLSPKLGDSILGRWVGTPN